MGKLSLIVLLFFGLTAGMATRHLAFDDDEFQHAHMAWLLTKGEVPHRDFFEHHLPLYHFILAPSTLGTPGPQRILALRGLSVFIAMATLSSLSLALKRWTGSEHPGVLILVAFSPIFFIKMIEVRPEGFCLLLACAALVLLKNPRHLLTAGLLSGAMVMGSQKFIFLAAGLFLVAWSEYGIRRLPRFIVGGLICPLLIGLYYFLSGSLPQAFHDLVTMNLGWKESFSPLMYARVLWTGSALLIVAGLMGLSHKVVFCLLLTGLAAVCLVPIPFRQTFLMLYPGLALGAAFTWRQIVAVLPSPKQELIAGCCLSLFALLPALANLRGEFQEGPGDDLALMSAMDERGTAAIFDGRRLLFYREHVGHYPWMHQGLMMMLDPEDHAQQSIRALIQAGYPDVLWDYRVEMMATSLHLFLQQHYIQIPPDPLWVPGTAIDRSKLRSGTDVTLPAEGPYVVSWQGGTVQINGEEITPGQMLHLGTDPIRIRGNGFIREFKIYHAGRAQ